MPLKDGKLQFWQLRDDARLRAPAPALLPPPQEFAGKPHKIFLIHFWRITITGITLYAKLKCGLSIHKYVSGNKNNIDSSPRVWACLNWRFTPHRRSVFCHAYGRTSSTSLLILLCHWGLDSSPQPVSVICIQLIRLFRCSFLSNLVSCRSIWPPMTPTARSLSLSLKTPLKAFWKSSVCTIFVPHLFTTPLACHYS